MFKVKSVFSIEFALKLFLAILTLFIAIYISRVNYKLFHSIVEIFCFIIAFAVFIVAINAIHFTFNKFYITLGIGYLFVGIFKVFHMLAYPGLGIIEGSSYNLSAQFYYCARYIQAATLLISCRLLVKPIKKYNEIYLAAIYSFVSILFMISILQVHIFPTCYVLGQGNTYFKMCSTVFSIIVLTYVAYFYSKNKCESKQVVTTDMILYCILNAVSEFLFLFNLNIDSTVNMLGHIIEVVAFCYLYKGIVKASLKRPHEVLVDRYFEKSNDLELKISEVETVYKLLSEERIHRENFEKVLFDNHVFLSILVDKSPIAIAVHSGGKVIFGNGKLMELLEEDNTDSIIGHNIIDFFLDEFKEVAKETVEREYKEINTVHSGEMHILTRKGKVIETNLVRTQFDFEGKPATLAIFWDISMYKKIEGLEKDAKINKELLKQSLEFNKLVTEFFANVSHELRTPLNVIFSAIQLLELKNNSKDQNADSEFQAKYYNIIKQNCFRLLRLINNLIDLSKISSGFISARLENHNIVSVVEGITLSVADYVKENNIELIFDTEVEEKIMACDEEKIERIILNLLSNAIKFTKSGDKIMVAIFDKGDKILISVKDTGIGIPKEKLDIIFERFEQVENSLARNKYGSGIGLSLVKSFVEIQEGKINIKSEVGVGTEFLIELPVKLIDQKYDYKKDINNKRRVEMINIEFSDIY